MASSNAWEAAREWAKEAAIAWDTCALIHEKYAEKKDAFFITRQANFKASHKQALEMVKIFEEK